MSQFKFEGEIEEIDERQFKLVEIVLRKQGFKDGKVIVEPVGQKGDNYMAKVKRFIYEKSDGSNFKMIGKIAPTGEQSRKIMNTAASFINEITMYEEVMSKFNDLQNIAGVPANERVRFPVCYGALREAPHETILLEDLKESGFVMLDRFQPLSNNSVRLTLKDLAIFHSLSYVLKGKEPETYKNFTDKLFNMWIHMDADSSTKMFFEMTENDLKSLVDSEKHKQALTGSLSQIAVQARKLRPYEITSKYSVIHQGDCWSNNIMFRLEDGKELESVMIDYQLSKESNPAADLLYLILNCTDHAMRRNHFYEWIDYYHEMLDDSLANYGLKSNRVYSKDQLDADLRRYGKMMVGIGVLFSSMLVRESKDAVDFKEFELPSTEEEINNTVNKMSSTKLDDTTVMRLKKKLVDVIDSGFELGLI